MDKIEIYKEFDKTFSEYLSEIEVFIPNVNEKIGKQQILSMVRRFSYLQEQAEKIGFDFVSLTTSIIVEFLAKGEEIGETFHSIGHIIIDTLRLGVALAIKEAEGRAVPSDYESMLLDGLKSVLIQHSENIHSDEFYKQWVLVADDEEIVRIYVEDILFNEGYLVLGASNGREAITAVSTGFFDIVFTDINMPFVSGLEVLKHIKDNNISVDVIVITGYASVKSASEAIHRGAYDYITKPFSGANEVINAAERAMQHRLLIKSNEKLVQQMKESNLKLTMYTAELEEALNSLEEKNNALIKAERMATLGVLVAGLAHEINNPTTFIRGNIQTLKKFWTIINEKLLLIPDVDSDARFKYIIEETPILLKDMLVGTERIAKITRGLRAFARVDGASEKMDTCSINDIIDGALAIVANRLSDGIVLDKKIDKVPLLVASLQQMIQVVVNLMLNALDAVENQSIKLISIRAYDNGDDICVEVVDNGEGIPKKIQDKIFDPFFTTKSVDRGTGLGLSLSEGIVSVHGGYLKLISSDCNGSTFELALPKPKKGKVITNEYPKVMMLAEPSLVFKSFESGIRASECCELEVIETAGGDQGILTRISEVQPDVVILDMKWGGRDGGDFLRKLSECSTKNVRVLGVADSRVDNTNESNLLEMGFDRIILLPCNLRKVLVTLEELL